MFGIRVENVYSSVQIDSTYSTYRIISRGESAPGASHPEPSAGDVLLVRSLTGLPIYPVSVAGNVYATSATGIEYLVVRPSNLASPSNDDFGLRVLNDSSELIFDSGNIPVAPIANVGHTPAFWNQQTRTPLPPPLLGRNRYIEPTNILRHWGVAWNAAQPPGSARWIDALVTVSSSEVTMQLAATNNAAPAIDFMPVDVEMHVLVMDALPN